MMDLANIMNLESDEGGSEFQSEDEASEKEWYTAKYQKISKPDYPVYKSSEDAFGRGAVREGRDFNDIQSQIWRVLSQLDTSSKFTIGNHKSASPNPGLRIPNHGIVGLPLSERDAETIVSMSKQSPFGKKEETIVDTSVRNSWELDASEISLDNPEWNREIQEYVSSIYEEFDLKCGRQNVTAELYKLLLYEQGAFFKAHKDSEKVPGMFATLIVCLPSAHEGGTLVLQHGTNTQDFRTSSNSAFGTSWAAWYSDVTHQVTPVISGYRLVLTYNLIRKSLPDSHTISVPNHDGHKSKLCELLKVYDQRLDSEEEEDEELPSILMHKLEHKYTKDGLKCEFLKGPDAAQLQALAQVSRDIGFGLYLATLELELIQDGYEETERSQALKHVVELDGTLVAQSLNWEDYSVIDPHEDDRLERGDYDDMEEEGWTGNEGGAETQWYRDTVIVIVPPSGYPDLVTTHGFSENIALSLLRILKEECTSGTEGGSPRQRQLNRLCSLILCSVPREFHSSLNSLSGISQSMQLYNEAAVIALETCDMLLFERASRATNGKIVVVNVEAVGRALSQIGVMKMKPLLEQAVERLPDLETRLPFLQKLEKSIRSCDILPAEIDLDILRQWSDDKLLQVAFESKTMGRADGVALAKISKILDWDYFASTTMEQFSTTNTIVRVAFVNEFLRLHFSQLDQPQESFVGEAIKKTWESFSFSLPASMTKSKTKSNPQFQYQHSYISHYDCYNSEYSTYRSAPGNTSEPLDVLTGEDLRDFIQNSLSHIPSNTFEGYIVPVLSTVLANIPLEVCSRTVTGFIKLVIEDRCIPLHLEASEPSPSESQKALVQSFITAYIEKAVGRKPKKPTNWSLPVTKIRGNECPHCNTINNFLSDRVEKTYNFRGNKDNRKHLDAVFKYSDQRSYEVDTIPDGRHYVWRITKNNSGFQRAQKQWDDDRRSAQNFLSSLAHDHGARARMHAFLDPQYETFMEADPGKLSVVQVPRPLAEVDGNVAASTPNSKKKGGKRGRPSSSAASENASKKLKHGNEVEDSRDENVPRDVEIVDLT